MSLPQHADFHHAAPGAATAHTGGGAREPVRIRKYPNRRLYDTSRSRHLTHQGVLDLIAAGYAVEVTDSRTGSDITNVVLLQILIERDPARLGAIPTALLHRLMRAGLAEVSEACARAMRLPPSAPSALPQAAIVGGNHQHAVPRQVRPEMTTRPQ